MPSILVACDKFKGTLTAKQVGDAVASGIRKASPDAAVSVVPVADGGDGTVAAAVATGMTEVSVRAIGPTGEPTATSYARRGDLAVVEMASVSGLVRLPGGLSAPMTSSSRGTGEVIGRAVDSGCRNIVLGIGGSACTDGGAGLLRALGARLTDSTGREIGEGGAALAELAVADLAPVRARMDGVTLTVACDVDNPLTGHRGAAAVYGPQKGAAIEQVRELDRTLTHWADVVARSTGTDVRGRPGAGAAGGVGFAALAVLDATLRPGIGLMLDLAGFREHLLGADLVVTGEGMLDEQTLHGKAPAGVSAEAARAGVPVVAVCGQNLLDRRHLRSAGISAAYALTDIDPDVRSCIEQAARWLERIGEQLAVEHADTPAPTQRGASRIARAPVSRAVCAGFRHHRGLPSPAAAPRTASASDPPRSGRGTAHRG